MTRIKRLKIHGLRGIKNDVFFDLEGKSLLLFAENGGGKSSITDSLEWFFYKKIDHLSGEEIGRSGGIEALRSIFLPPTEKAYVQVDFTDPVISSEKSISNTLDQKYSNRSDDFLKFIDQCSREKIILRHIDLIKFVAGSKTERLIHLSNIIGFSEVTKVKTTLKKAVNDLKKEIKLKGFDNQMHVQQARIIEHFGCNVLSDQLFVKRVNELARHVAIDANVTQLHEVDNILDLIKQPEDTKIIELQSFYNTIIDTISRLQEALGVVEESYQQYYITFLGLRTDIEKIKQLIVKNLLQEGVRVLEEKVVKEESCPLCLQPKNREELLNELRRRISDLAKYEAEYSELNKLRRDQLKDLEGISHVVKALTEDKRLSLEENQALRRQVELLGSSVDKYAKELGKNVLEVEAIGDPVALAIDRGLLEAILNECEQKRHKLTAARKEDAKFDTHSKIVMAREAYVQYTQLNREKTLFDNQLSSLEAIWGEFAKKQKESLESFLSTVSGEVNSLYLFMNPDEKIENIKLVPLEKDDELAGLTIEFSFFGKNESPPHKYLSESHLNSLGIAFFLTSVRVFNRLNKIFVLDDVISSFDKNHRIRFCHLLNERFLDYQIIVLSHEREWFDFFTNVVRNKWIVSVLKWDNTEGAYVEPPPQAIRAKIETKLSSGQADRLGTDIGIYLEGLLKAIALNLEVRVKFLFNDRNEDRMAYELLSDLKGTIKKHAGETLKNNTIVDRLMCSNFVRSKDSHDSSFCPAMGDLKALWADVQELEELFYCRSCKEDVSLKFYDRANKKVQCRCKGKIYEWKE